MQRARAMVTAPFFERLTQHLQHRPLELRQLVQKQHAVVRERDLARPRVGAAADEAGVGDRVVRRAERPPRHESAPRVQQPADAVDLGRLQRLVGRERGQDAGHAPGEHRLARARRADHERVVPAGRRHFERALRVLLPPHVREIHRVRRIGVDGGDADVGRAAPAVLGEQRKGFRERADAVDFQTGHGGGFGGVLERHDHGAVAGGARLHGHRQHAAHGPERAVERELAADEHLVQHRLRDLAGARREQAERDGQVERRALFAHVGRGEVDGDGAARHGQAGVLERRPDAVAALADGAVGQAHHGPARQVGFDVGFDLDGQRVDSEDGAAPDAAEHGGRGWDGRTVAP